MNMTRNSVNSGWEDFNEALIKSGFTEFEGIDLDEPPGRHYIMTDGQICAFFEHGLPDSVEIYCTHEKEGVRITLTTEKPSQIPDLVKLMPMLLKQIGDCHEVQ
jgi:hypothetical protein